MHGPARPLICGHAGAVTYFRHHFYRTIPKVNKKVIIAFTIDGLWDIGDMQGVDEDCNTWDLV